MTTAVRCQVDFDGSWQAMGGLHGGYVLAPMLREAERVTGRLVATASAHYHAPVIAGPAEITATVDRTGRSGTSVRVGIVQDGAVRTSVKALCVDAPAWPASHFEPPLTVPGPDALPPEAGPAPVSFRQHVEFRPVGPGPFAGADKPELTCWVRLHDPVPYDVGVAAILLDVLPPSVFATMTTFAPIPTMELTAHFVPGAVGGEWVLMQQRCVWSTPDLCADEATLRAQDGTVLAQMRQLRKILDV